MSKWHKRDIGDSAAALSSLNELMHAVAAFGISLKGQIPAGFGVFSNHDIETDRVTWYFSPEAADLARKFGGQPCEKPIATEGFGLQAGNQGSAMIYFPEYFRRPRSGGA